MSFKFGKYREKMFDEVFEFDEAYCRWLFNQDMILTKYPDLKEYLTDKFKNADLSYKLNFGKYKNKTINQVLKIDKGYLEWLLNSPQSEKMTKLRSDLKDIL